MEPCCKRPRLDESIQSKMFTINSILSDEYSLDVELKKVLIALIEDVKNTSKIIEEINRSIPINELQHLKRVKNKQIILCTKDDLLTFIKNEWSEKFDLIKNQTNDDNKQQFIGDLSAMKPSELLKILNEGLITMDFLKNFIFYYLISKGINHQIAKELTTNRITIEEVPSRVPKLRWQYDKMNKIWPCKFHPDKYMESLYNGTNFKQDEKDFHQKICSILYLLSKKEDHKEAGICIDPRTNSIVAITTEKIEQNPILHCSMVLIDFVARTQNGGVWNYDTEKFMENQNDLNFQGITENHFKFIKDNFKDIKFGAQKITLNRKDINLDVIFEDNLNKYGPYLCTGYDIYLLCEPCVMCAMALVHSRVRRIFYVRANKNGAFGSKLKLHTIKELNHRFEVFHCLKKN